MKHDLAIIIPAYKRLYLKETLQSLADQSCKDFTLYIGDDASPEELYAIVQPFESQIDIVYKHFDTNLGGTDLVAHWERCMALVQQEEWIWMFSDDDLVEPDCVEKFYLYKNTHPKANLWHFNTVIIDQNGTVIKTCNPFPEHLSVAEFFARRTNFMINSAIIEYIFKRETFYNNGGFKNYDLAWCADDATWIKLGTDSGITTISGPIVSWRYSGANISSNVKDKSVVLRKLSSVVEHLNWVENYFTERNITDTTTQFQRLKWAISLIIVTPIFSIKEKHALVLKMIKELGYQRVSLSIGMY
ncbi:MAG: glycosyltransferase family 2 protein, partial [Sphingobacteriaceae bacterium]